MSESGIGPNEARYPWYDDAIRNLVDYVRST